MVGMYREHSSHDMGYLLYYCMVGRYLPGYHRIEMLLAELEQVGSLTGPGEAPSD